MVEPIEDKNAGKLDRIRPVLQHFGFNEVISFSFSDPAREAVLENGIQPVEIRNPISAKASHHEDQPAREGCWRRRPGT